MKIERVSVKPRFFPVRVVLETPEEVAALKRITDLHPSVAWGPDVSKIAQRIHDLLG